MTEKLQFNGNLHNFLTIYLFRIGSFKYGVNFGIIEYDKYLLFHPSLSACEFIGSGRALKTERCKTVDF